MGFLVRNKFAVLAALALAVTAALFGHWRWRSWRAMDEVRTVIAALEAGGWRAEVGELSAAGAPNRIDLSLRDVRLASPDGRWSLETTGFATRALTYRGDYLAFLAPEPLRLETPLGRFTAQSAGAAASLIFEGDRLIRLSVDLPELDLTRPNGETTRHDGAQLHLRWEPAQNALTQNAPAYRVYVAFAEPPGADALSATLDGRVGFPEPPARAPLSAPAPDQALLDPGLTLTWPDAELRLSRRLERRAGGWSGLLHVESDQAPAAIGHLETLGLVTAETAALLRDKVSAAGRLAGVLAIAPGAVALRDVGPEEIPLWSAQRQ